MQSPRSTGLKRDRSSSALPDRYEKSVGDAHRVSSPKHRREDYDHIVTPILKPNPGESKAQFFTRLGHALQPHRSRFSPATTFHADGIYVYKRPVRSASPQHQMLLGQAGTILHHVIVYLKLGSTLTALEYGPAQRDPNGTTMDVTSNFLEEATPGPVVVQNPEPPEAHHLPMLHIDVPHHALDAAHVATALEFAMSRSYQALRNNCIAFSDFIVRVLTGGAIKNAPLIFDHLVGQVPPVDSPLLPMLQAMLQTTWHDIADGSRLMYDFIKTRGHHHIVPVGPRDTTSEELVVRQDASAVTAAGTSACTADLRAQDSSKIITTEFNTSTGESNRSTHTETRALEKTSNQQTGSSVGTAGPRESAEQQRQRKGLPSLPQRKRSSTPSSAAVTS